MRSRVVFSGTQPEIAHADRLICRLRAVKLTVGSQHAMCHNENSNAIQLRCCLGYMPCAALVHATPGGCLSSNGVARAYQQ